MAPSLGQLERDAAGGIECGGSAGLCRATRCYSAAHGGAGSATSSDDDTALGEHTTLNSHANCCAAWLRMPSSATPTTCGPASNPRPGMPTWITFLQPN